MSDYDSMRDYINGSDSSRTREDNSPTGTTIFETAGGTAWLRDTQNEDMTIEYEGELMDVER